MNFELEDKGMSGRRGRSRTGRRSPECRDSRVRGLLDGWAIAVAAVGLLAWTGEAAAQTAPKITSISVDDAPSSVDVYGFGERIDVLVYFDQDVRVEGNSPQVALQIGTETRYASYWYYGPYVHFAYIVTDEDRDSDGISIPANALSSGGPSIVLASDTSVAADLGHEAVAADPNHKVDGSIVSVPTVEAVAFQSDPGRGDTFGVGEAIEVGLSFDKSLANALSVVGGEITLRHHPDIAAELGHEAVPDDPTRKVDGSLAALAVSIDFWDEPSNGDTYEFGERVAIDVVFDQEATVSPLSTGPQSQTRLTLEVGTRTRQATLWGAGGGRMYFVYLVAREDVDMDGIRIPANALKLNGASISLEGGAVINVDPTTDAVVGDPNHKVDGGIVSTPRVETVYFQGSPENGDTYALGEGVGVGVNFDKAVVLTGEPEMAIQVGERTRRTSDAHHGASLGSLGSKINYGYTVRADDVDTDGVSIPANALTLNGGAITLLGHPDIAAELNHEAVADDPTRKVDGSLGPKVTGVSFLGSPDNGDTYTLGETIQVLVEFDQSVRFDFRTRLALGIGEGTRQAAFSRSRPSFGTSVTFEYLVQAADLDGDGTSIPANAMTLNGGSVTANLSHEAVAADGDRKVDGSIAVAPKIASVSVASRPRRAGDGNGFPVYGDTYALGEAIQIWVEFDKPVRATGKVQLGIAIGRSLRHATYRSRSSPYRGVSFDYVVQPGDVDSDGIAIPENALTLNGGTIAMQGKVSIAADLTHEPIASEHRVDGSVNDAPRILWGTYGFSPSFPINGEAFGRGETIEVSLFVDRRVEVSGQPQLALQVGTRTRQASFRELFQRGTSTLLFFEYVVQSEDLDSDGIGFPANAVTLNGGRITLEGDAATDADLAHDGLDVLSSSRKVDGSSVATPAVTGVLLSWQPANGGTYSLGETIYASAGFAGGVRWSGRPQMAIEIGEQKRRATYTFTFFGSSGVYLYRVQVGDLDEEEISIPANSLTLNDGAITTGDASGNADLTHDARVSTDGFDRRVDASIVVAPRVTGVFFTGNPLGGATYGSGETIEVRVAYDKVLVVRGEPRLQLRVGRRTREARFVRQGTNDTYSPFPDDIFHLFFEYTVQPGDVDADGISIPASALSLNGGSLTLEGSPGTAADLSHSAVNPDETRLVDAPDTAPTFSTAVAGQVFVLAEAVSLELPEAVGGDGELTYSLSPELPAGVTFDPETRVLAGMPVALADLAAFEYTVTDGDLEDPESATLTFSMSVIAQPATEVGGESAGDDAVEVTWRGPWTDPSRGRLVIEARSPSTDWTVVGTVDPSTGEFIVRGLEPETPYTFRGAVPGDGEHGLLLVLQPNIALHCGTSRRRVLRLGPLRFRRRRSTRRSSASRPGPIRVPAVAVASTCACGRAVSSCGPTGRTRTGRATSAPVRRCRWTFRTSRACSGSSVRRTSSW